MLNETGRSGSMIKSFLAAFLIMAVFLAFRPAYAFAMTNPTVSSDGTVTWDCIYFGNYYQGDSSKKEPIMWRVLSVNGNDVFLLADQSLDCFPYHTSEEAVTWETSSLRTWLNDTFYNAAFNNNEKNAIRTSTVINDDYDGIDGGNDTQDRIYLLSINEVKNSNYGFTENSKRRAKNTKYAEDKGAYTYYKNENSRIVWSLNSNESSAYNGNGYWWLRSPGEDSSHASSICYDGSVWTHLTAKYSKGAVRPCLHIDLTKPGWTAAGTKASDGTFVCAEHKWSSGEITVEATTESEGEMYYYCTVCNMEKTEVIPKLAPVSADTGKSDTSAADTGKKSDTTAAAAKTATARKANTMTVKAKKVTVSVKTLKKKNVTVKAKKAFTIKKAVGKVTYKKVSGSKKITVSKAGKITVKKKTKKGKYTIKVKVTAAGNNSYKSKSKTVKLTVTVK